MVVISLWNKWQEYKQAYEQKWLLISIEIGRQTMHFRVCHTNFGILQLSLSVFVTIVRVVTRHSEISFVLLVECMKNCTKSTL